MTEGKGSRPRVEAAATAVIHDAIDRYHSWARLGAFSHLDQEKLVHDAEQVARDGGGVQSSPDNQLHGLPIAVKDNIAVEGEPLTCGSKVLSDFRSCYDAHVISALKGRGAIPFGRTAMDEFGMGSTSEYSSTGPVRNPWMEDRVPGGSSGGSAVAVATGIVSAALGSDTGGSVRQPAALCGVVGIRPTWGRVSRRGLVAFSSSLDQIGVLGSSVEITAAVLEAIAGHDPGDATSSPRLVPAWTAEMDAGVTKMRVGVVDQFDGVAPEIQERVRDSAEALAKAGAQVSSFQFPDLEKALAAYYLLSSAEASSNLSRFDGIRYGVREVGDGIEEMIGNTRGRGLGLEVKRRILLGTFALSAGYHDAYYGRAIAYRDYLRQWYQQQFEVFDVVLSPTTPTTAKPLGHFRADPVSMYLSDLFTIPPALAGIPAISVPVGTDSDGLPIGVQLQGALWCEGDLFRAAAVLEEHFGIVSLASQGASS